MRRASVGRRRPTRQSRSRARRSPSGSGWSTWVHDPEGTGTEVRRILARTDCGASGPVLTLSDPPLGDLQQAQLTSAAGTDFAVVGYAQGGAGAADPRRIGGAWWTCPAPGGTSRQRHHQAQAEPPEPVRQALPDRQQAGVGGRRAHGHNDPLPVSEARHGDALVRARGAGRKVGKRCVKPKRSNRRRKRCTRYAAVQAGPVVPQPGGRAAPHPLRGPAEPAQDAEAGRLQAHAARPATRAGHTAQRLRARVEGAAPQGGSVLGAARPG